MMTKQEEIREKLKAKIGEKLHDHAYYRQWDDRATQDLISKAEAITDVAWQYLHSAGCVLTKHGFYSDLMEPLIEEAGDEKR